MRGDTTLSHTHKITGPTATLTFPPQMPNARDNLETASVTDYFLDSVIILWLLNAKRIFTNSHYTFPEKIQIAFLIFNLQTYTWPKNTPEKQDLRNIYLVFAYFLIATDSLFLLTKIFLNDDDPATHTHANTPVLRCVCRYTPPLFPLKPQLWLLGILEVSTVRDTEQDCWQRAFYKKINAISAAHPRCTPWLTYMHTR